ncbi:MAG: Sensor histidine kinase YpdA [Firmicutes bacterium ADurb.Bin456]|nr:MAG: Sensor histidine kinase YpdA [Firmicutes bacterium ADurb.Bin456]
MSLEKIISKAMEKAQSAQALMLTTETSTVDFQFDRLKAAESSQRTQIDLKVIVDGKVGTSSTTDPSDVEGVVSRALEAAQFGSPANFDFPEPQSLEQVQIFDPALLTLEKPEMIRMGQQMMDMVKSYNPEILSGALVQKIIYKVDYTNSKGANYSAEHTAFNLGAGGELVRGTDILYVNKGLGQKQRKVDTEEIAAQAIEYFRMAETINVIKEAGLRDKVLIAVGGSPVTAAFAKEIGADYYFPEAAGAARVLARDLKEFRVRQSFKPSELTLGGRLNEGELEHLTKYFTEATGLRVVFLDERNQHIGPPSLMEEFLKQCHGCRWPSKKNILSQLEKTPLLNNNSPAAEPFAYFCPAGLVEMMSPLIYENQRIGNILCGHFYLAENLDEQPKSLHRLDIKVLDREQVESARGLLKLMGDYVVKMAYANQKETEVKERQHSLLYALKAKMELEKALRKAELLALQSQVNPHFLFNTLNTIARLAFLEGAHTTEKTVHSLARVLRYNLRRSKDALTIEEEMGTIKDYLFIQQTRFAGRLEVTIDVEEEILGARVPCLSLQPIVENAIVHGIEPSTDKGVISIRGYDKDGGIVFEVVDNGIGMSQDEIDLIFSLEKRPSGKGHTTGIGLYNIQKRMQAFFKENCALQIKSTIGKGCRVQLFFPKLI